MTRRDFTAVLLALGSRAAWGIPRSWWAEGPAWETYVSAEGKFSVRFPGKPKLRVLHNDSFLGDIATHVFAAEAGEAKFSLAYSDLPRAAVTMASGRILEETRAELLKDVGGKQTSWTDAPAAKLLVYDKGRALVALRDIRLYVVDGRGPERALPEIEAFLKSFASL